MLKNVKLFFIASFTLLSVVSFGQGNNPYNQRGIDFATSLGIITEDFKNGVVNEINEETINNYSTQIPLQNQITVGLASNIVQSIKDPSFNLENLAESCSLSTLSKETIAEILDVSQNLGYDDYKSNIVSKVEQIKGSQLLESEKEATLSIIAIVYNYYTPANYERRVCTATVVTSSGVGFGDCVLILAIAGAYIGWEACGIWCALGGAVIGAVTGLLS